MESQRGIALHYATDTSTNACELQLALEAQVASLQHLVAELLCSNERLRQALGWEYAQAGCRSRTDV
jgi:hypothetical protein